MALLLNLLINSIISSNFQNSRCILLLSDNSDTFEYKGDLPVVNLNIDHSKIDENIVFQSYGCQEILIQHENASDVLTDMEEKLKLQKERFNFRKYLIAPSSGSSRNLTEIFEVPVLQYIVNILIIIPEEETLECQSKFQILCEYREIFKLITSKYVGKTGNNDPKVLDLWFSNNQSFLNGSSLYPDKISNQKGRTLRCATFNYKPYSIIEFSQSPMAIGSENALAHEYAVRHNMTIEYVLDDDEWGIIYDNWTGTGILGNVAIDKADMGYGALYTWEHEYGFLDLSKPVVRTGVTCLVPAPRLAAGYLTPFLPFSPEMWIGVGISFIVASFATTIIIVFLLESKLQTMQLRVLKMEQNLKLSYKKMVGQSLGRIFRIFLIQSVPLADNEADKALKYMFIVFLFSLLTASSYSSGLASVMTLPRYEGAINTPWDLATSGINWGATQDAWIFSIMDEKRPQYVTIVNKFIPTSAENLREFAKTDHFAFSIERLPSGQYAIGNYITEGIVKKLRLMHEDLYWEYCVFMLRKSSPLLPSLDNIILELTEAGIIKFWEMKTAQTHMDLRVQNIVKYYATAKDGGRENTVKLQWVHVEGAFAILIVGYAISIGCFITEMIFYKRKHRKGKF